MAWPTFTISSWEDYEKLIRGISILGNPLQATYLHRGQSDADWSLQSSILRTFKKDILIEEALKIEENLLSHFKSQAHIHIRPEYLPDKDTDDITEWWQIMQHYGAPTRLLDWTASSYVAAYFAVVANWDKDGAIWTIHPHTLVKHSQSVLGASLLNDQLFSPLAPLTVHAIKMTKHSNRTLAQQGHFTVPTPILCDQENLIDSVSAPHQSKTYAYGKTIIPKHLKPEFLYRLRQMNVSAVALFPGEDGVGRSIHELALLANKNW